MYLHENTKENISVEINWPIFDLEHENAGRNVLTKKLGYRTNLTIKLERVDFKMFLNVFLVEEWL